MIILAIVLLIFLFPIKLQFDFAIDIIEKNVGLKLFIYRINIVNKYFFLKSGSIFDDNNKELVIKKSEIKVKKMLKALTVNNVFFYSLIGDVDQAITVGSVMNAIGNVIFPKVKKSISVYPLYGMDKNKTYLRILGKTNVLRLIYGFVLSNV